MDRQTLLLAGLAAGGQDAVYPPAQVQKLFFLLDREVASYTQGPHFAFEPYDYGPFDAAVYSELDRASSLGFVAINRSARVRTYALTLEGYRAGADALAKIAEPARTFFCDAAKWVNSMSFAQLVSAIYQKYPDMKTKSVFRG